jgi:hypothetical protein
MSDEPLHRGPVRTLHEHMEDLMTWERTEGLFDYRLNGIPLWRLVRSGQISAYLRRAGVRGRENYNRPQIANVVHFIAGVACSLAQTLRLRRYRYLFIGFARRRLDGGVWVDTFSDPLIDLMGRQDTLCIERPFGGRHFRPARTRHLLYYDWIKAASLVAGRLFAWIVALRGKASVNPIADLIANKLGAPAKPLRRAICRAYMQFWTERQCARFILRRVSPKAMLLVNRGINFGLIAACRERGVRVHELQHGVMQFTSFKHGTRYDERIDPETFLTFGECWTTQFDWGVPRGGARTLGYRYILEERTARRRTRRTAGSSVMLVSEPGCWQELSRAFGEMVARHPEVHFILKFHPQDIGDWRSRYPVGLAANVTAVEDPAADLYDLFGECRAVVGYASTVLYEASFFGLKVGLLNENGLNPSEALRYIGRFNFFELAVVEDFGRMLASDRLDESKEGNPFFAAFDQALFDELIT